MPSNDPIHTLGSVRLAEIVLRVLSVESPIHEDEVARLLGFKVSAPVRGAFERRLESLLSGGAVRCGTDGCTGGVNVVRRAWPRECLYQRPDEDRLSS